MRDYKGHDQGKGKERLFREGMEVDTEKGEER